MVYRRLPILIALELVEIDVGMTLAPEMDLPSYCDEGAEPREPYADAR